MPRKMVRNSGPVTARVSGLVFTRSMSCTGTGSMTSTWPDSSAATRVASLPMGVKTTSATLPSIAPQYCALRVNTVRTPGWRSRSRNGPVPLARNDAAFSTPLRRSTGSTAWFASHHLRDIMYTSVRTSGRMGYGDLVSISTV